MAATEGLGQPSAQRSCLAVVDPMRFDNLVLAAFQRAVEIIRDIDIACYEPGVAEFFFNFAREIDQHKASPGGISGLLDLCEAMCG